LVFCSWLFSETAATKTNCNNNSNNNSDNKHR
jgi:hypothetical protein